MDYGIWYYCTAAFIKVCFFVGWSVESVFYFSFFFHCPHEVVSESSRLTFKVPRVIRFSLINWYMMVGQGRKVPLQVHTRVLYIRWVRDCIPNSVHHIRHGHLPIVPGNEPFCLKKLIQAFFHFCSFDFCNFLFSAVFNPILFSSLLVLLSNLDSHGFCFPRFFYVSLH